MTPCRAASPRRMSMLVAPRILKAPIGCRFSHLSEKDRIFQLKPAATGAGEPKATSISGVRYAMPRIRSVAASISSRVTSVSVTAWPELVACDPV